MIFIVKKSINGSFFFFCSDLVAELPFTLMHPKPLEDYDRPRYGFCVLNFLSILSDCLSKGRYWHENKLSQKLSNCKLIQKQPFGNWKLSKIGVFGSIYHSIIQVLQITQFFALVIFGHSFPFVDSKTSCLLMDPELRKLK